MPVRGPFLVGQLAILSVGCMLQRCCLALITSSTWSLGVHRRLRGAALGSTVSLFIPGSSPTGDSSRRGGYGSHSTRDRSRPAPKAPYILREMVRDKEPRGPIVFVGGYMSWPVSHRGLARLLADISGSEVHVVPITPFDWALGGLRGYGQLVFEVASTVDRALLESDSDRAVLVGYSAGGILSRVYIGGDPPYGGRRYSGHRRVSHLITLGTPHNVADGRRMARISEVNDFFPGALHAGIRYLCVTGAAVDGASSRRVRKRYERFADDGRVRGDGEVPIEATLLPGAESLVLDDVYHGRFYGGLRSRWYGSDRETVERWWPEELRVSERLVERPRA
jgi:pimeloyl-ACP methyl ester carboxylesterase